MTTEQEYLHQRAERMSGSAFDLSNPERRHEADGIGATIPRLPDMAVRERISEAAEMALEFVNDCCDPEGLGHALPPHVIARAGRIRAMLKPKACPIPSGVGYTEPPPARCEFCDSE